MENGVTERVIGTLSKILKKTTVIPADWDTLLPMAVFAYNSAPHEATGESPFYILHAFDPNYPSNESPADRLNWNFIDYDDYKYELLNSIQLARESVKELNEEYKARMKSHYDAKFHVKAEKLPRVGDRVYVKAPREKATSKYPKF